MTVKWSDKICIHAAKCVKNLPSVFNEKFVIDESGAQEDEIKRVVGLCPSGALKIED